MGISYTKAYRTVFGQILASAALLFFLLHSHLLSLLQSFTDTSKSAAASSPTPSPIPSIETVYLGSII